MNETKKDDNVRLTENDLPQEFVLKLLGQHEARGLWGIKHTREPVDFMVKYAKTHELSLPIVQVVVTKEGVFMSPIKCNYENKLKRLEDIKKIVIGNGGGGDSFDGTNSVTNRQTVDKNDSRAPPQQQDRSRKENKRGVTADKFEGKFNVFVYSKPKEKKKMSSPTTDLHLLQKYSGLDWRKSGIFFFGIDTISYGVQDLIYTRIFSMIVIVDNRKKYPIHAGAPFMCHAFVCESRNTARRITYALAAAFQAYARSMKFLKGNVKPSKCGPEGKPKRFTIELMPPEAAFNDSEA